MGESRRRTWSVKEEGSKFSLDATGENYFL